MAVVSLFIALIWATAPAVRAENREQLSPHFSVGGALNRISSILKKGINKIPLAGTTLRSTRRAKGRTVSGTPPTLDEISKSPVENIFWRPDVVASIAAGTADQNQCGELFSGAADGLSGGLGVCELAEGIGYSFETMIDAQVTFCYMKAFPTNANLKSGGVHILTGAKKIPERDFTKIFSAGPAPRLVKIDVPKIDELEADEQNIFLQIDSTAQNRRRHQLYHAEIFYCLPGAEHPRGFDRVMVDNHAKLTLSTTDIKTPLESGSNNTTVNGYLKAYGSSLDWDPDRPRNVSINFLQGPDQNFKSAITITGNNLISIKRRNYYQSSENIEYSVSQFSGSSVFTAVFSAGAFKGQYVDPTGVVSIPFDGAAEYRDTYYASAPQNELTAGVNSHNLTTDPFFPTDPTFDTDTSKFSCAAKPDVEVALTAGNQALISSLRPCIESRLTGMDFCYRSELLTAALNNYGNACH